jgi:predicted nucleotidyltransferase
LSSESTYYTISLKAAKGFSIKNLKDLSLDNQGAEDKRAAFRRILQSFGVGLAYFFGSQKELGPMLLDGREAAGSPGSDLDLGVVLLAHPWDYREGEKLRWRLQEELAELFRPVRLHLLLLEEENAHVQHAAAIRGLPVYAVSEEFARQYRRKVYTLYADWHSWW